MYTLPDGTQLVPAHQKFITGQGTVAPGVVGINNQGPVNQPIQVPTQATGSIIPVQVTSAQTAEPVQMVMVTPVQAPTQSFFQTPAPAPVTNTSNTFAAPAAVPSNPAAVETSNLQAGTTTDAEKEQLKKEIEAFKNSRNIEVNKIVDKAVGTPENKLVLDKWVDTNLNSYEKRVLNDILSNGSVTDVQDAMNAVISRYNSTFTAGSPNAATTVNTASNPANVNSAFNTPAVTTTITPMSAEAFQFAIMDPRYEVDPVYTDQVNQSRRAGMRAEGKVLPQPRKF